jgi:hypothetical protein
MAQKTRTQIQTEISNTVVSNNDRGITAQILNDVFTDLNDSTINQLTDGTTLGLYQFNVSTNYNLNQCVVYNNQIYKANQNVTAGTFSSNQWNLVTTERKCVLNIIGNTNNPPTIYVKFDNLFGVTPTATRNAEGNYTLIFNSNVFNNNFSINFGAWDNAIYLPTHPVGLSAIGNSCNLLVYDWEYQLVDIFKGYMTITQYT